jgi:hypothetical protein
MVYFGGRACNHPSMANAQQFHSIPPKMRFKVFFGKCQIHFRREKHFSDEISVKMTPFRIVLNTFKIGGKFKANGFCQNAHSFIQSADFICPKFFSQKSLKFSECPQQNQPSPNSHCFYCFGQLCWPRPSMIPHSMIFPPAFGLRPFKREEAVNYLEKGVEVVYILEYFNIFHI